jgi:hypothetical protein
MVNLNNLPCELGNPGQPPVPVDPIDGGSVDQPEDDGDDIIRPPIFPVPTVWACEAVTPGASNPSGRLCSEYRITQIPAGVLSVHGSKADCEFECYPVVVCRKNRITGVWECLTIFQRDLLPGEITYPDQLTCQQFCGDTVPPGGGGGGPGTPTTGTPTGPATPGPGTGPGPQTPGPGTGGPGPSTGTPFGPVTQGPGPSTGPGTGPGPSTGGPTGGRIIYYICEETIVGCAPGLGSAGWTEAPLTSTTCRCRKRKCKQVPINYTTPYPPAPGSGQYRSCAEVPNCNPNVLIPIPDTCPDTRERFGPVTQGPGPSIPGGTGPSTGTPFGPATQGPGPSTGPGTGPGPSTGGPTGGRIIYYNCKETIVGCTFTLGSVGWQQAPLTASNCRCIKKICSPIPINYTTPYPPAPGSGQYRSCAEIPNCNPNILTPIPNSCPDNRERFGPVTEGPGPVIPGESGPTTGTPFGPVTEGPGPVIPGESGPTTGTPFGPVTRDPGAVIVDDGTGGGVIITPTDGTPINPIELPTNQDGQSLPEYQYDPNQIDRYTELGYSFIDNTYAITTTESNTFITTESTLYENLLNTQRDYRVQVLATSAETVLSNLNKAMSELSLTNLKNSIKPDLRDILFNLTYPDGRPIPQDRIAKAIKKHLLDGTLDQIDTGYIKLLSSRATTDEAATAKILDLPMTQFGRSKADITLDRKQQKQNAIVTAPPIDTTPNQSRGVVRALQNARSLDPDVYTDQSKDLLKLWYILPTDINRRITVSTSSNEYPVYIQDTDTIPVTTSSGSVLNIPVDRLNYSVSAITSSYEFTQVSSNSDIDRAVILNNVVEQATLHDVGSKWQTIFTVTSPSSNNLELTYSLEDDRPLYYVLNIDRSTIEDVPDADSIFTKKTRINYTLETNAANIREAIKFRIYPWKLFTINHNDPILGHFGASSTYQFEFTNFSLKQFGTDSGEQLFVRRIPELIIILPTNKYQLNFFNGYSRLLDWNQRRIIFSQSPDPRYSNTGLDQHWIKVDETYPGTDINDTVSVFGKKGTFTGRSGILSLGYTNNSEPLPRKEHGFRSAALTASSLYLNYEVDSGLLWSDVFIRMTADQYKTFKIGIPTIMMEKLRLGEKTGVKLLHNRNDNFIKQTRVLTQRPVATQEVPVLINKFINDRIREVKDVPRV